MEPFSVSDVAEILGVNGETIRRWIRDGRLNATRGLGRGGSSILLEDLVAFVNQSPGSYALPMMAWLDRHDIPYENVFMMNHSAPQGGADSPLSVQVGIAGLSQMAGNLPPLLPAAASMVNIPGKKALKKVMKKAMKKTNIHPSYVIRLLSQEQETVPALSEDEYLELPKIAAPQAQQDVPGVSERDDETSIRAKIIEEQIKLVKLNQELARITAEIAVSENQIKYYNLMLQRRGNDSGLSSDC